MWPQFPNKSSRIPWIDVARAIALFLVVSTHFYTDPLFHGWAYAVHIPTFFFISGLVGTTSKRGETFLQFVRRQFFLFLFFYVAAAIILLGLEMFFAPLLRAQPLDTAVINVLRGRPEGVAGVLWFLPTLLWVRIVFDGLRRLRLPIAVQLLLALGCAYVGVRLYGVGSNGIFWSVDIIPIALVFYIAGAVSVSWSKRLEKISSIGTIVLLSILLTISMGAISALLYVFTIFPNVANNNVGVWYLFYPGSFAGIGALLLLGRTFQESQYLRWLGERTLPIYLYHLFFVRLSEYFFAAAVRDNMLLRFCVVIPLSLLIITGIGLGYDRWKEKRA